MHMVAILDSYEVKLEVKCLFIWRNCLREITDNIYGIYWKSSIKNSDSNTLVSFNVTFVTVKGGYRPQVEILTPKKVEMF